jgi:hypothetical protein
MWICKSHNFDIASTSALRKINEIIFWFQKLEMNIYIYIYMPTMKILPCPCQDSSSLFLFGRECFMSSLYQINSELQV